MSDDSSSCDKNTIIDYTDKHIQINHLNESMDQVKKLAENFDNPRQHSVFSNIQAISQMKFMSKIYKLSMDDNQD